MDLIDVLKTYNKCKQIKIGGLFLAILSLVSALFLSLDYLTRALLYRFCVVSLLISLIGFLMMSLFNTMYHMDIFYHLFNPKITKDNNIIINVNLKRLLDDEKCMPILLDKIMLDYDDYIKKIDVEDSKYDMGLEIDFDKLLKDSTFQKYLVDVFEKAYSEE